MKFQKALFIFRRDLRLEDNTGLIFALEHSQTVIPSFIFTPEQIDHNEYRSDHCLQFMIESLQDLQGELVSKNGKLYLFYDHPEKVIQELVQSQKIDAVVVNRDYTPFSRQRDKKIADACKKLNVAFHDFDDVLLHPPEYTLKSDGKPYSIFTPYYRNAMKFDVENPVRNRHHNYYSGSIATSHDDSLYAKILPKPVLAPSGGRSNALKILDTLKEYDTYETLRDFPAQSKTTHLSAHLKFTTCSVREVYWALADIFGRDCPLIRALFWRDFFTSIAFYFPHVFSGSFHEKYDKVQWVNNKDHFKKWCEGKTGFPIVDAGMREMNQTGFMHNRVRMIVASFLVKDLHIDWRWGEKYFAQKLIDYDPAVNNGNWQWAASTGCDAQPYFRIFNPWSQSAKFDLDCEYIKQWIPELAMFTPTAIHKWYEEKNHRYSSNYPAPLVDHAIEAKLALEAYKSV
ncbi:MAG: DNA photolyase family protein [Chlamydiales bacterium]|nr:DNA photolyase family protein [Chlamydiales bacterium]